MQLSDRRLRCLPTAWPYLALFCCFRCVDACTFANPCITRTSPDSSCTYRCFRIAVPPAVGVHDPHQVREQLRHPESAAVHRQLALPQGLQERGAPRYAAQHLRQDHPVHRAGVCTCGSVLLEGVDFSFLNRVAGVESIGIADVVRDCEWV